MGAGGDNVAYTVGRWFRLINEPASRELTGLLPAV